MFAIGLPMMPLIMFSSAIIAWIIYTIAAVMSGPIIAIGLISPGGGLGKAAPALMLLINLFMRPSLHVIGLVAGAKMFNIAYLYFTQAFITTVYEIFNIMSLPSDGTLMSLTSIIYMYAYTFAISAICSRCYSLITVIPDKAFTWVGAPPMGIPDQISQSARTAVQRSASQVEQKAAEMAKGLDEFMKQKVDEAMEKIQEREERGEARRNLRDDIQSGFWNAVDRVDNMRNNADNFFGGNQAMREASSALNSSRMNVFKDGIANPLAVIASIRGEAPVGSAYRMALDARTAALGKYYTARLDYASSQEFAVRRELATSNEAVSKAVKQVENETRRLDNGRGNIESLTEARESLEKAQNMQQQSLLKVMDYMQANPARADVDPGHTIYRHAAQYHDTSFSLVKAAQDSLASAKSDMAKLMAEAKKHRIPAPAADVTKAQNAIDAAQTRLQTAIDNHKNLRDILKTNEAGLTNTVKMRLKLDVEVMIGEKTIGGVKTSVLLTPAEAKRIKDAELAKAFVAKEMSDAAVARAAGTLSDPQMVSRLALQDKLESFQKTGTALPQEQLYVKGARLLALGVGSSLAIAASPFIVIGSGLAGLATGERATTNSIINSSFQFLGDKLNINQNFKMTFGDLSAYGSSLSIRAQAATGYFSHQISASFAIDPAYNRAVAAQYAAVGAQARAHNQSIQPRLVEPYQGATRRELRDARKAVAVKRYEMSQAGKTERDILKDPDYQKLMQTVKDAENKLDRGNVFMQGLRSLDRGIKSGTKIMGETSRSTIREYLGYGQVIVSQDWGSATGIAKGVGAIMVAPFVAAIAITHVGADLAVRLPVALLVKVPGALMRPNRAKHMTYSDRQIFAFQQLSYKTDSYNSSGLLSYDHLSAAQSFRDIANVVTLGIVTLNSPMKKIAALSGGAGASSTAAASSITTTVSDGTISSASAPPPPTASGGAATSSTAAASSITIPVSDGTTSSASAPPTASGGAATSSTAAASSITIPVSDGTTSFASAPPLPTASGGAATSSTAAASSITIPVSDGTTSSASASPAIVSEPGPSILSDGAVSLDAAPPATASDGGLLSPYTAGLTTGTIHISTTAGVAGVNVGATLTPPIPNLDSGNVDMASAISTIPFGAEHNSFVASNGNLLIVPTEYPGLSESPSGVNPYLSQPGVIVIQS
jgi:hypothetical protein